MQIPPNVGGPQDIPAGGKEPSKTETPSLRKNEMAGSPSESSEITGNFEGVSSPGHKSGFFLSSVFGTKPENSDMANGSAMTMLNNLKSAFNKIPE